jgi:hypothetical protein
MTGISSRPPESPARAHPPPAPPFFPPLPEPDHGPIRLLLILVFVAVLFLSALGVAGILTITIASPAQAAIVNGVLISFLAPTIAALFGLLAKLLVVVLKQLNSRLSQWMAQMEITAAQQHASGLAEGLAQGKAQALSDVLSSSGLDLPTGMPPALPVREDRDR